MKVLRTAVLLAEALSAVSILPRNAVAAEVKLDLRRYGFDESFWDMPDWTFKRFSSNHPECAAASGVFSIAPGYFRVVSLMQSGAPARMHFADGPQGDGIVTLENDTCKISLKATRRYMIDSKPLIAPYINHEEGRLKSNIKNTGEDPFESRDVLFESLDKNCGNIMIPFVISSNAFITYKTTNDVRGFRIGPPDEVEPQNIAQTVYTKGDCSTIVGVSVSSKMDGTWSAVDFKRRSIDGAGTN